MLGSKRRSVAERDLSARGAHALRAGHEPSYSERAQRAPTA